MYNYAHDGNMRAAKIFMDATNGPMVNISTIHNQQNNFIQVNGLVITEDQVKGLSPDKLNIIREIITGNVKSGSIRLPA